MADKPASRNPVHWAHFWRFVLMNGVVLWGLSFGLLFSLLMSFVAEVSFWTFFAQMVPLFCAAGAVFGAFLYFMLSKLRQTRRDDPKG